MTRIVDRIVVYYKSASEEGEAQQTIYFGDFVEQVTINRRNKDK